MPESEQKNQISRITKDVVYIVKTSPQENESKNTSDKKNVAENIAGVASGVFMTLNPLAGFAGIAAAKGIPALAKKIGKKSPTRKLKNDDVQIIPLENAKSFFENDSIKLLNVDRLSSGLILVKHPFLPNTFIDIAAMENELFHTKIICLSKIMQCLGAKSIKGYAHIVEEQQRGFDGNGKLIYKEIKADASGKYQKSDRYESEYKLEDTFGGIITEESYEDAKIEARSFGLDKDFDIKNLIEQRNPQKTNSMKSRKVSIELSRELNKALDAAFELEATGLELGLGYKEILESRKKILFELEIVF